MDSSNVRTELDFNISKKEVEDYLKNNTEWILATSAEDQVTSRSMSIINDGLAIYFQTDKKSRKYQQIISNKNVAMAHNNYQIEGIALECGHPLDRSNEFFRDKYKSIHKSAFEKYSSLKDEVVIKVIPKLIIIYKYFEGLPYKDYLYTEEEKAYREELKLEYL